MTLFNKGEIVMVRKSLESIQKNIEYMREKRRRGERPGIYKLVWEDGDIYYGKTEMTGKRLFYHNLKFKRGEHAKYLQSKYDAGIKFEYKVIAYCEIEFLKLYETILIRTMPCINQRGKKLSKRRKEKLICIK